MNTLRNWLSRPIFYFVSIFKRFLGLYLCDSLCLVLCSTGYTTTALLLSVVNKYAYFTKATSFEEVWEKSSHYGLYTLGFTRATRVKTNSCFWG